MISSFNKSKHTKNLENNIIIQTQDFSYQEEYLKLLNTNTDIGAVVTFCGLVRDFYKDANNNKQIVSAINLECYKEMAQKVISTIILETKNKFNIINARVIHRIGLLKATEQIVFVGVATTHRTNAFLACEYIIDFLKIKAPFWKKEINNNDSLWVEQKNSDIDKTKKY